MPAPAIGTYIRPVPRRQYCLEVVRVIPEDRHGPEQWWCRRHGYDQDADQPIDDGMSDSLHYLNGLEQVFDGVWKDPFEATPRWTCCPLYYKRIDVHGQQMGLF